MVIAVTGASLSHAAASDRADEAHHHLQTSDTSLAESGPPGASHQFIGYGYDHPAPLVQFADVAGMAQVRTGISRFPAKRGYRKGWTSRWTRPEC